MTNTYTWKPLSPKQAFFLAQPWDEGLYGGAAGGGKSESLANEPIPDLMAYPGTKAIFFRREFTQLEDIEARLLTLLDPLGVKYNSSKHRFNFSNGSRYYLGHLQHEKDKLKHQGREYGIILFDELTHFTETQYLYLLSRNRDTSLPPERWRMRSGTNPGGPGHGWVKRRFIDCLEPYKHRYFFRWKDEELPVPADFPYARSRFFVPATVKDNPVYAGGQYEANLMGLPDDERRMLYEGDWSVFKGQMFYMWRKGIHVLEYLPELSPDWYYFGAMDWGDVAPFCYLLFAVTPRGNVFCIDELYDREWSIKSIAAEIKRMESKLPVPVKDRVADWNIFGKRTQYGDEPKEERAERETLAKMFRAEGINFGKATKNRVLGWATVKEFLRWEGEYDGTFDSLVRKPRLRIMPTCQNLIRTLPELVYAGSDGSVGRPAEDIAKLSEDHPADTLRYGLMHIARPSAVKQKEDGWKAELRRMAAQNIGGGVTW